AILFVCVVPATAATPSGSVHGTVTSEGAPLTGAVVTLLELNRSSMTDQLGRFEFRSIPEGKFVVFVRMIGYENASREITVANDSVNVEFSLDVNPIASEEIVVSASPNARMVDQLYQSAESR